MSDFERTSQRMAQLQAVTAAFSQALTPAEVCAVIVEQSISLQGAVGGMIATFTETRDQLKIVYAQGYPPEIVNAWATIPLNAPTPVTAAIRRGEPLWLETISEKLAIFPELQQAQSVTGNGALAALPLIASGKTLGGWGLSFARERSFSQEERAFLQALSQQCAQALERAALYTLERQRRLEAEAMRERTTLIAAVGQVLNNSYDDLDTLLYEVCRLIAESVGDLCVISLLDAQGVTYKRVVYHPEPAAIELALNTIQKGIGSLTPELRRRLQQEGKPVFVPIIADETLRVLTGSEKTSVSDTYRVHSWIIAPLRVKDETIGAMSILRDRTQRPYTEDDLHLVEALAERAALTIYNGRLYHKHELAAKQAEEALALLQTFVQSAPVGFAFLDNHLRCQLINEHLAALINMPGQEYIGKSLNEILPEMAFSIEPLFVRILQTGLPILNHELISPNTEIPGQKRYWLSSYYPIHTAGNQIIGLGMVVIETTERRRAEQRQLLQYAINRILAQSRTADQITKSLLNTICGETGYALCELWLLDRGTSLLRWEQSSQGLGDKLQLLEAERRSYTFSHGTGLAGRAWSSKEPTWFTPQENPADRSEPLVGRAGLQSGFAFPIFADGVIVGVITAFNHPPTPPDQALLALLSDIGHQIGQFFERVHAEDRMAQYAERLRGLHAIDQAILALQPPAQTAQTALRFMQPLLRYHRAGVLMIDIEAGEARILAFEPENTEWPQIGKVLVLDEMMEYQELIAGTAVFIADLQQFTRLGSYYQVMLQDNVRSFFRLPITSKEGLIGSLTVSYREVHGYKASHITIAREVAAQLAVAFHNARLFEQVQQGRERLQLLSSELVRAQEAERKHIARELHDQIGQSLTAALLTLQGGIDKALPSRLETATELIEQVLQQVRTLSLELRPSMLDDLGLIPTLRWFITRQAELVGFHAEFIFDEQIGRYPNDIETTCYRIVQEALNNATRHAQAHSVRVELTQQEGELKVTINDDGVGFDVEQALRRVAAQRSFGLLSMQERVALVGGTFQIDSAPGEGTTIFVRLPIMIYSGEQYIERRRSKR
jgi:signal transduction histidine kinase/PAS domain-containing protein